MGRGTLTPQEEELKKVISNNIRIKIKEEGVSQAEFSRRTGIPPTTLSGYVKGVTRPSAGNLQKISDSLGVLKSDIDPSYKKGYSLEKWRELSPTVSEITKISSQLDEPRQKVILSNAKTQLKEQTEQNNKVIPIGKNIYTDEELMDIISRGVASDGTEQTEAEKEFFFNLIKNHLEGKDED